MKLITVLLLFLLPLGVYAQQNSSKKDYGINLTNVQFNETTQLIEVSFNLESKSVSELKGAELDGMIMKTLKFYEKNTSTNAPNDLLKLVPGSFENLNDEEVVTNQETTVLFVLDRSGTMSGEKIKNAKNAIIKTINDSKLPEGSFYFSYFDNEPSSSIAVNKRNIVELLKQYTADVDDFNKAQNMHTDLWNTIVVKTKELDNRSGVLGSRDGKKIIILLTDGKNDISKVERYKNQSVLPLPTQEWVLDEIKSTKVDIYAIGVGNSVDSDFLEKVASTNANGGYYSSDGSGVQLTTIYKKISKKLKGAFKINLRPIVGNSYSGEALSIIGSFRPANKNTPVTADHYLRIGNSTNTIVILDKEVHEEVSKNLFLPIIVGICLIAFFIFIAAFLFPLVRNVLFKQRYITPYKSIPDMAVMCNFCAMEIHDGEEIVKKCEHTIHYDCWAHNGSKCTEYPLRCKDGHHDRASYKDFFSQNGIGAYLSWATFGASAMLLAWIIYELILLGNAEQSSLISGMMGIFYDTPEEIAKNSSQFYQPAMQGMLQGLMLAGAFGLAEELKHFLGIKSILRIVVKALIGGLVGFLLFFFTVPIVLAINTPALGELMQYFVFGVGIGASMSIGSSVSLKSGLIGGAIASFIAYWCALGISEIPYISNSPETARLIKFVFFGGILGGMISVVVSMLENFYLEIENGKHAGRKLPVSKWLKEGLAVHIGKEIHNNVVLDWELEIGATHAEMKHTKSNEATFIRSMEDSKITEVNGRILTTGEDHRLRSGDVITIGNTKLRYEEKR